MHSLGIVQRDSTRRDHPGYPGRVSGSGLVKGSYTGKELQATYYKNYSYSQMD